MLISASWPPRLLPRQPYNYSWLIASSTVCIQHGGNALKAPFIPFCRSSSSVLRAFIDGLSSNYAPLYAFNFSIDHIDIGLST